MLCYPLSFSWELELEMTKFQMPLKPQSLFDSSWEKGGVPRGDGGADEAVHLVGQKEHWPESKVVALVPSLPSGQVPDHLRPESHSGVTLRTLRANMCAHRVLMDNIMR